MKNMFIALALVASLSVLAGCGCKKEEQAPKPEVMMPAPEAPKTEAQAAEQAPANPEMK